MGGGKGKTETGKSRHQKLHVEHMRAKIKPTIATRAGERRKSKTVKNFRGEAGHEEEKAGYRRKFYNPRFIHVSL